MRIISLTNYMETGLKNTTKVIIDAKISDSKKHLKKF